ncbi:MFS transporter [Kamptonema sp. UHCC 0994]|uniref:MFS transporter n=1 Tax=Kamptonema sp. UHCC 0994 TaxID=3031329 RepID=UPI0023BB1B1C|nr:MFS transporter [Kamptonema sp. UHCC 0994]MDF0556595.1 MFS transporter [Kamptonema sp. UHCC 0994]
MVAPEKKRNPGLWVSILYFAEGFPYTVVNLMSVIFLKGLGASNELIGLTSLLSFPWVLKGLWGPIVDLYSTKRQWILNTEIICACLFFLLALGVLMPQTLVISLVIFTMIAFVSATHDIAIDGFYLNSLNKDQQALFVGVRNTAYRGAVIAGSGLLVFLAGSLAEQYLIPGNPTDAKVYKDISFSLLGSSFNIHPLELGWATAFGIGGIIFIMIYLFQQWYLPYPKSHAVASEEPTQKTSFFEAFRTYFTQYKIGWIVTYVLIFRLGDALTFKMAPPFLMDTIQKGGLAVSTAEMGLLSGTIGVIFLLIGGLLGGYLIAKQGLKKWMWPTAILQNSTNVLYWLLAMYQPSIIWAYAVNSIEQFTYGLGVAAYTVFLMRTVRPEYEASHYAITTAFMAAGVLIPGVFSGYLQTWLGGYQHYFLFSSLAVIPGMLTIFFLPLEDPK